jgi:hypothetical protein
MVLHHDGSSAGDAQYPCSLQWRDRDRHFADVDVERQWRVEL